MEIDLDAYREALNDVRLGKRTASSRYLHRDCVESLPPPLSDLAVRAAAVAEQNDVGFDVLKFGLRSARLSLLSYPGFFDKTCKRANN